MLRSALLYLVRRVHARAAWRLLSLALICLIAGGLLAPASASSERTTRPASVASSVLPEPATPFRSYLVRLAEPSYLVFADASPGELNAQARQRQRDDLAGALQKLVDAGLARSYAFDEGENAFRADLGDPAREKLAANPLVAAIELDSGLPLRETPTAEAQSLPTDSRVGASAVTVSSVNFVQVYSPFMWGRVSFSGLTVTLTLEDGEGNLKGVPSQRFSAYTCQERATNEVKVDKVQLYYETVFVNPSSATCPRAPVIILPGDRVHVVTSGTDPTKGPTVDERWIVADDVRAWTSYDQDAVFGQVLNASGQAQENRVVTVTIASSLGLSQYFPPDASTYTVTTTGPGGTFSAVTFRGATDPAPKKVGLQQGSTGFVRVGHDGGDEVFTVHGQNVFVLENSSVIHGYAFPLPSPVSPRPNDPPLDSGVVVSPRPHPTVVATLRSASGQFKDTATATVTSSPYTMVFSGATISGGDIVEVSINQSPNVRVTAFPLTANVDVGANEITGSGPASTLMVLAAGRVSGYVSKSSLYDYIENRVTTTVSGGYVSGKFRCGTTSYLTLQPGSFGYVGYEEEHGNFVYMAFAAPTNHVMSDYPYLEGWVADGTVRPSVTVRDSTGTLKHQGTVAPSLVWMVNKRLYINTFYFAVTSQFIVPGDTVVVASGGQSFTIPVDRVTAFVNTDADIVSGIAPAGATVRVIPADDRSARREVVADANGEYSVGNPFTYINNSCTELQKTVDFVPGEAGRAYVRHADGSEVFGVYGRSLHVNQNGTYVEVYQYIWQDLDWWDPLPGTPRRKATLVLTPTVGSPVTVEATASYGPGSYRPGKTGITISNTEGLVYIRAGDSLMATFEEGPEGLTRPVTLTLDRLTLFTASPDLEANTVAGVGPRGWTGQAVLKSVASANPAPIAPSAYTAYGPVRFVNQSNAPLALAMGHSGTVSFSDAVGHRIWTAWAVTAYPVKIKGWLKRGDTLVCGTAPPGSTVRIHDVTTEGVDLVIGTGTADSQRNFCVTVSPPLFDGQVVLAEAEMDQGTAFSQPVVVGGAQHIYLPLSLQSAP